MSVRSQVGNDDRPWDLPNLIGCSMSATQDRTYNAKTCSKQNIHYSLTGSEQQRNKITSKEHILSLHPRYHDVPRKATIPFFTTKRWTVVITPACVKSFRSSSTSSSGQDATVCNISLSKLSASNFGKRRSMLGSKDRRNCSTLLCTWGYNTHKLQSRIMFNT